MSDILKWPNEIRTRCEEIAITSELGKLGEKFEETSQVEL